MSAPRSLLGRLASFFSDDEDDAQASLDPVHVAGAVLGSFCALGALYWLLWTLLVYEGGVFLKLKALAAVLLTSKTFADFGWAGTHDRGVFEGWAGTLSALILCAALLAAVQRAWTRAKPPRSGA